MATLDRLGYALKVQLAQGLKTATERALVLAGPTYGKIVNAYGDLAKNGPKLARVNAHLAELMREATLDAYRSNVLRTAVGSYRRNDPKRNAGALLRALESPSMARGTATGIGFIDEELLDREANHWKRLNYGAAPAVGSLPARTARIRFGSNQGFSIALRDPPRPAFRVPEAPARIGYFLPNGEFYPGRPTGRSPSSGRFTGTRPSYNEQGRQSGGVRIVSGLLSTHGIGARRFLDEGLVALAANFTPVYRQHFEDVAREAASRGGTTHVHVRA